MTCEHERAYVQRWVEAGRLLEEQRWQELRTLSLERATAASDALIELAIRVPLPEARRIRSGLVEQQAVFHRTRP